MLLCLQHNHACSFILVVPLAQLMFFSCCLLILGRYNNLYFYVVKVKISHCKIYNTISEIARRAGVMNCNVFHILSNFFLIYYMNLLFSHPLSPPLIIM